MDLESTIYEPLGRIIFTELKARQTIQWVNLSSYYFKVLCLPTVISSLWSIIKVSNGFNGQWSKVFFATSLGDFKGKLADIYMEPTDSDLSSSLPPPPPLLSLSLSLSLSVSLILF